MPSETATFGAGCFWGVEHLFRKVPGVIDAVSGYSGGIVENPTYRQVCSDTTGHAEVVEVTFDPEVVSFEQLLEVFWAMHDPTQVNRQGPDVGTQYRSAIFYADDRQKEIAQRYIDQINQSKVFGKPIATKVTLLEKFYPAEDYHQNYLALHPNEPYIVFNDLPKVEQLKKDFPSWYR